MLLYLVSDIYFIVFAFIPISLSRNDIGAEGAVRLAEALKYNNTLTVLKLVLIDSNFTPISLYGNHIGDEGAVSVAEAMKSNNTLTVLV